MTSNDGRKSIMLMGLPFAGKTTFLAALYHVALERDVPRALVLERFNDGDRKYIEHIRSQWGECLATGRTHPEGETHRVNLTLRNQESNAITSLSVPDLSGELFRVQVDNRFRSIKLKQEIANSLGFLIFINPSKIRDPMALLPSDRARRLAGLGADQGKNGPSDASTSPARTPARYEHKLAPDVVKFVELLQFLRELRVRRFRLSLIVSAFDTLSGTPFHNNPEGYIEKTLSLLWQFLSTNKDHIDWRIYGISAQGADYTKPDDVSKLLGHTTRASQRIRVYGGDAGEELNDITSPIKWMMQEDHPDEACSS
jgi:hypothetical protein